MTTHLHRWWYQPPFKSPRLNASRHELGGYWYCNEYDDDRNTCHEVSYTRPEGAMFP